jgi:hypothetical protein
MIHVGALFYCFHSKAGSGEKAIAIREVTRIGLPALVQLEKTKGR